MPRCAHCRKADGVHTWTLTACADGGKPRRRKLCGPCDVALNALALSFLRIRGAQAKVAAYTARPDR